MKRFLVVAIALFAFKASGQIAENMFFTEMVKRSHDSQSSILRVQGNLNFGSNGVDNVFASKMAFGGHIEKDRIKDIYTNMKTNGRVKTDLNYHLQFWSNDSLNSKKWNLYGGIGSRYYGQGSFNKDVFGILFRGNKPYAGTSLDLKNTDATVLQYMKYSIGVHREYQNKKGNLSSFTGASLSYIQGIDYLNFETKNTSLFTEASGQYVDLDLQYKLTRASRPKGFSHLQGHGVAIDAFYGKIEENYFWETSISDLGMVAFSNLISFICFVGWLFMLTPPNPCD